jgi:hypothetical protein
LFYKIRQTPRADCFSFAERAPALKALYQTDYRSPGASSTGSTSFQGFVGGDIQIKTDGLTDYSIHWTGNTIDSSQKSAHAAISAGQNNFKFDEDE